MEFYQENLTERRKVAVSGEDGQISPRRDGADQEIGVGSLNSIGSAAIEKISGLLEVRGLEFEIRESSQVVA